MMSCDQDCEPSEPLRYLSKEEAVSMEMELLGEYRFGQQQLMEIWGHACAVAITKAFPLSSLGKRQATVLVVCGPDQNGCIGLACARHLRMFEYVPTVFYPKRSPQVLQQDFTVQCERMDIPFLSYLPAEVQLVNDAYNLVVDAVLGPETDLAAVSEPFPSILLTLRSVKIPIASLDIPSGWDEEEPDADCINPTVLISLMAPKKCALGFPGTHFLAGRFLPYDIQKKYELNLPKFPGWDEEEPDADCINPTVLISLMAPKKCALGFPGTHFLAGRFLPYDIQKKYELNLPKFPGTDCLVEL